MKIQCDVCGKEEASVFCCADEAALCDPCDRRVHRANKLAGKHRRFSLLYPGSSGQTPPRCDVCQEKRAFLFCQDDRAILCRDCDGSIHAANDLKMKHRRFLLTGIKLSSTATPADGSDSGVEEGKIMKKAVVFEAVGQLPPNQCPAPTNCSKSCSDFNNDCNKAVVFEDEDQYSSGNSSAGVPATAVTTGVGHSSSISDYLMNTLPGWRVDDLLFDYPTPSTSDSSPLFPFPTTTTAASFCKMGIGGEDSLLPFMDAGLNSGVLNSNTDAPIWWAPRVPQVLPQTTTISFQNSGGIPATTGHQKWRGDDGFTVPQIRSHPPLSNKRSRSLWCT